MLTNNKIYFDKKNKAVNSAIQNFFKINLHFTSISKEK